MSLTNVFVEDKLYLVIALRKLMKPVVRKAPEGAFRYFRIMVRRWKDDKKHFLSYEEQIDFLKEKKKLDIADVDFAKRRCLKQDTFR